MNRTRIGGESRKNGRGNPQIVDKPLPLVSGDLGCMTILFVTFAVKAIGVINYLYSLFEFHHIML